jgi:spore coat polysaccharide biosynthesis protein SpsF
MLAILQARMSSTRLPGKVLKPLLGEPMLARQIERLRRSQRIDRLVVATSDDASDDPIAKLCDRLAIGVHRGSLSDVLGRYWGAARQFGPAGHIVRLTGDCPLADWQVIDAVLDHHLGEGADFTSNDQTLTFPKGLDVEVFKAEHLETAYHEARDLYEREHVTPFFYRNPGRFRIANLECDPPLGDLRWTVDTPEDFAFVERVYQALYPTNPAFLSEDVARLTQNDPPRPRDG